MYSMEYYTNFCYSQIWMNIKLSIEQNKPDTKLYKLHLYKLKNRQTYATRSNIVVTRWVIMGFCGTSKFLFIDLGQ